MSSTISTFDPAGSPNSVYPLLVTTYSATSTTRHLVHQVLGSASPDVTLQAAGPRTGSIAALFDTERGATILFQMLQGVDILSFSDDDSYFSNMTFIANGTITIAPDGQNAAYWVVAFDFLEV